MIFYFTGTGNSGYVANEIAKANNDKAISISEIINEGKSLEFNLNDDEIIGIVYPTYAYAPPQVVRDFIKNVKFNNYKNNYIFSIVTCGGTSANALDLMKKYLANKNMTLNSGFSIVMPNNYIILGDVDSKEVEKEKLQNTKNEIDKINLIIKERKENLSQLRNRLLSNFLTNVVRPVYDKFFTINASKFNVTNDCVSCGKCVKVCNSKIIKLVDGKPQWNGNCYECLACLNYCPTKAIQYGKSTIKKGRYTNPYFKQK